MPAGLPSAAPTAAVVGAMVERLLPDWPALAGPSRDRVAREVAAYVATQIAAAPSFLRLPMRLALHAFALLPLLRDGRTFAALRPARQAAYLALWSDAPVLAMRDLVKLVRSTALLAYFDHPEVRRALLREAPEPAWPPA